MGVEETLYPKISGALRKTGGKFPDFLANNFARVLQRIEFLWGEKEAIDNFDALFLGDTSDENKNLSHRADHSNLSHVSNRSVRRGFPIEAVKEIVLLKQVHQLLFPEAHINQFDPFSGSEIVPIDLSTSSQGSAQDILTRAPGLLPPSDDADQGASHRNLWPIIHTEAEFNEKARTKDSGENIYPLQGKAIGEILTHYGLIDENTLRVARNMQKRPAHKNEPLGEILVDVGTIQQEDLTRALLIQAGIMMVDILSLDIPAEIFKTVPLAKIREKLSVPIGIFRDTIYIAIADPFSFPDQSFFAMLTGLKVCPVYAPMHEIVNRINVHGISRKASSATKEEFRNLTKSDINIPMSQTVEEDIVTTGLSENDSIIVNLVNQIILNAVQEEASDIHIELFNDGNDARIRFRRDGIMEHFSDYPRTYHKAVVSRIKIISGLDISEKRRPQDGKISFAFPDGGRVDLRVATIPAMLGVEFVTIRILASGEPVPLGNLGMIKRDVEVFSDVFQRPYGLILVCGPTGSGKTTTLHSVLKELNTEDRKIWTAEDPVEIVQSHLCQVQVNSKIGMTFATVLRSFLRADPDVIMIGEMRDQETAKIALEASMTGHLVLSTLHTNSASETVARLLDLDIDTYNLADALLAILAQRLARKLCTSCAVRKEASASDVEDLATEYFRSANARLPTMEERNQIIQEWREKFNIEGSFYFMHAVGCDKCQSGYKGRIGLYELMHVTPNLRHLIRSHSAASEYLAAGVNEGMRTLKQDGIEKVIRGITDMIQVHGACI